MSAKGNETVKLKFKTAVAFAYQPGPHVYGLHEKENEEGEKRKNLAVRKATKREPNSYHAGSSLLTIVHSVDGKPLLRYTILQPQFVHIQYAPYK